ncbi:hypothetical protein K2W90_02950 [Candidatus Babeliales bacterium]|nr:hypothetical protein [Candidatus Babeliales bacterium]
MSRRWSIVYLIFPVFVCLFYSERLVGAGSAPAPDRTDRDYYPEMMLRGGYGAYMDKSTGAVLGKVKQDEVLERKVQEKRVRLQALQAEKVNPLPTTDMEKLDKDITRHIDLIKRLEDRRDRLFLSSTAGTLVARGFAGKDEWEMLDDTKIDNIKDGLVQGLTLRASKAVGDVLGKRIEGSCEVVLGGAWDKMFGWLVDVWDGFCLLLFHEDKKPFIPEMLEGWHDFIKSTFNDIERMVKDGLKDSLRGYDMTRRKFDLDATDDTENGGSANETAEGVWVELVFGYAEQFERIADELARRCEYYEDDSLEAFYARQIIKRLVDFKDLLLASKSLNDLDAQLHSNKAIITATKTNLENLFKRLVVKVTPRTYSLKKGSDSLGDSTFGRDKSSDNPYRRGAMNDDMYPAGMW